MGSQFFSPLILVFTIVRSIHSSSCGSMCRDIFLVRPGDGEEFVYSPVDVNATLHCAVNKTKLAESDNIIAELVWVVDRSLFVNEVYRQVLNSREIFLNEVITSDDVTTSSISIFDKHINNNSVICCQEIANIILENCTTLVLYGMPL